LSDTSTSKEASSRPVAPVRHDRLDAFGIAVSLMLCVFLGIGQVAMKIGNTGISPVMQAGLRSACAAVLLLLWCLAWRIRLVERDGALLPGIVSGLFFAAEFAFLYPGLERTTVSHAVVLLYTSPFWVALGAHWLVPGDRLTPAKVAGLLAALAGVVIVLSSRDEAGGAAQATLLGDLLCLAGGISWAGITLTVRTTRLSRARPERGNMIQLITSAAVLVGISLLLGEAGIFAPTPLVLGAFAYTVVFVAFITFTTTFWLLTIYPATSVMAFMLLTPAVGVAAGALLLGEPVTWMLLAGLAVIIVGLWLVNRPPATR
jgi:drug/metabolite transporter (DMT)-like permease